MSLVKTNKSNPCHKKVFWAAWIICFYLSAVANSLADENAAKQNNPSATIQLQHQIQSGMRSVYHVRIETIRRPSGNSDASVRHEIQTGRLTRIIFGKDASGQVKCAQMLELKKSEVTTRSAESQPSRKERFNQWATSPAQVMFKVVPISHDHSPLLVPGQTAWSRAMLKVVMHVADWPQRRLSVGDKWTRSFDVGGLKGRQHYVLKNIDAVRSDRQVIIGVTIESEPFHSLQRGQIASAESRMVWSEKDKDYLSLTGKMVYREPIRAGGHKVEMRLSLDRTEQSKRLSLARLGAERRAAIQLANAITAYHRDDITGASRELVKFRRRFRISYFKPMADYLYQRIKNERASQEPLPLDQLKETLVGLLAFWNQAETDTDAELQRRCRDSLKHLVKTNRPEIIRLLQENDGQFRALGCFILAFGTAPADLALIQQHTGDPDRQVRRMALYALTVRASKHTDVRVLLTALDDADETVRQRACQAIGRCITRDSDDINVICAALVKRLDDDSAAVVFAAAHTLMKVGSQQDFEKVKKAAETIESQPLKKELLELIANQNEAVREY